MFFSHGYVSFRGCMLNFLTPQRLAHSLKWASFEKMTSRVKEWLSESRAIFWHIFWEEVKCGFWSGSLQLQTFRQKPKMEESEHLFSAVRIRLNAREKLPIHPSKNSRKWAVQEVSSMLGTPWKINMEPTNHPFRKENNLPNLHDYVPC